MSTMTNKQAIILDFQITRDLLETAQRLFQNGKLELSASLISNINVDLISLTKKVNDYEKESESQSVPKEVVSTDGLRGRGYQAGSFSDNPHRETTGW